MAELYTDEEDARAEALSTLQLLDTPPEERFDRLCRLAGDALEAPATYISLIDRERQWFKATQGMGSVKETPRVGTFCDYAIRRSRPTVVLDATLNPLFAKSPFVEGAPNVRFYVGVPLTVKGQRVGTLCALDFEPRSDVSRAQLDKLQALARLAENEIAGDASTAASAAQDELPPAEALLGTILACKLHAFSSLCQNLPAASVGRILQLFHRRVIETVQNWGGLVEELSGENLRVLFGPELGEHEHASRAAGCAVELLHDMLLIDTELEQESLPPVGLAIALSTGMLVVGHTGSTEWSKPFVAGAPLELAAALLGFAGEGEILASEASRTALGELARVDERLRLRAPFSGASMTAYVIGAVRVEASETAAEAEENGEG